MILAKDQYRVMLFLPEYLEKTATLLARQFTTLNPIWSAFNITQEEAYVIILRKIRCCVNGPYSHLLVDDDNNVLGCKLAVDMVVLQQQSSFDLAKKPLFQFLDKIEKELEGELYSRKFEPGQAIYGLYTTVVPELLNKKIATYLIHASGMNAKVNGIKDYYGRVTNPVVRKMAKTIGAEEINSVQVNLPERGISNFTIVLIHISVNNVITSRAFL